MLLVILYFLREGITVDSLKIGHFQVQGLYLKLDKKLIANVQYLRIPSSRQKLDSDQIQTQLDRIKKLPLFFQYIMLNDVVMGDDHYRVIYQDNVIYLRNDAYEVAGMFERKGDEIHGEIPYLHIKKLHLQIKGTFRYNYRKGNISAKGDYRYQEIDGHFSMNQLGDTVHFALNSSTFAHTTSLLKLPGINSIVKEWIGKRLAAKSYQIVFLKGTLKHHKNGKYLPIPSTIHATVKLKNPVVRFHDRLNRIRAKSAKATLENNVLYIRADKPTYAKRDLSGSSFYLSNVIGKKPRKIHLNIKTRSPLDGTIVSLLKTYKLTLPLRQKSGKIFSDVTLDIHLKEKKVLFKGKSRVTQAGTWLFFGTPVVFHAGEVVYDTNQVILGGLDTDFKWLHTRLKGTIHLKKKTANLTANLMSLVLGDADASLLRMKNKHKIPLKLDWNREVVLNLPLYKTHIVFGKKGGFDLICTDVKPLVPYAPIIAPYFQSGTLQVHTSDGKRYRFKGKAYWPASYLYDKKNTIKTFPFTGSYDGKTTSLSLLGGRIFYDSSQNLIRLHDLYIDAKKLLSRTQKKGKHLGKNIRVKGIRSLIRYEKYVLLTDRFNLRINGKNTVFVATKDGDTVRAELNGNAIVIKAQRIKAPMLRALVHFGGLKGGRYSLDLHGTMNGTMKGVITIKGGTVSSFKTYNNMIALFNTVPALASLSDPGFSKSGFEVRKGRIEFRVVKNRIFFDMIYIDGKSAAISGKGTVSMLNGAINMDLAIRTARGIGKLIGSLPIVGYILMGKDKSITTGVKVTGILENPKVTTNVVMETLLAPFEMFTRVIQAPAHIINQ